MLTITVPANEIYDEALNKFIEIKETKLRLEHSLVSLSKWESIHCKPFLTREAKTVDETIDYIKCMTVTKNVDPYVYYALTPENIEAVNKYIDSPMTATTFHNEHGRPNRETITSELIYYWMISLNMQVDVFEKWHLSRLITLLKVCSIKNQPSKKMSHGEILSSNAARNAARRKQLGTKG